MVCLLLAAPAGAEEKLFQGKLIFPTLKGFEVFEGIPQAAGQPTYTRWDPQPVGKDPKRQVDTYLFSNSKQQIWLTVSRGLETPMGNRTLKTPLTAEEFDKKLREIAKQQNFQLPTSKLLSFSGGKAAAYQVKGLIPDPHQTYLIFIPPAKESLRAIQGYSIKLVFHKDATAKSQAILKQILKEVKVLPL